jgi:hypothetical protein
MLITSPAATEPLAAFVVWVLIPDHKEVNNTLPGWGQPLVMIHPKTG